MPHSLRIPSNWENPSVDDGGFDAETNILTFLGGLAVGASPSPFGAGPCAG